MDRLRDPDIELCDEARGREDREHECWVDRAGADRDAGIVAFLCGHGFLLAFGSGGTLSCRAGRSWAFWTGGSALGPCEAAKSCSICGERVCWSSLRPALPW